MKKKVKAVKKAKAKKPKAVRPLPQVIEEEEHPLPPKFDFQQLTYQREWATAMAVYLFEAREELKRGGGRFLLIRALEELQDQILSAPFV